MKLLSLFNDLGIIPNKGTSYEKDPALNQGQEFMDYNRMYHREEGKNIKALQITSIPGVNSIVENMENKTSNTSDNHKNSKISNLEKQFNRTLVEYDVVYKQFSEEVLNTNKNDKEIRKYFDQVITTGDGNFSYVNDYGFTHKYSNDAWSSNAKNCPKDPLTISKNELQKLYTGENMGIGQPCGIAGKNILNKETKEYAWVDIQGKKHVYSKKLWEKKNESCNIPAISLSDNEYKAIPSGGNMTVTDNCLQLNISPDVWNKMIQLNNKLEKIAEQLMFYIDELEIQDIELNMKLQEQKKNLSNYISQIGKDRSQINFYNSDYNTVDGEYENAMLEQKSSRLHYIVWFLVSITIALLIMHSAINPSSNLTDNIVVVLGLIFIYVVCKSIYNNFYYRI